MKEQKFILLPAKGLVARHRDDPTVDSNVTDFLANLSGHTRSIRPFVMKTSRLKQPLPIKVLDSIHEDGAKLIEIDPSKISDLHLAFPGVRIISEVFFHKAVLPRQRLAPGIKKLAVGKTVKIRFINDEDKGIPGVDVIAFSDFENGLGAQGKTNSKGLVTLKFSVGTKTIERLYVYPPHSYWPLLKKSIKLNKPTLDVTMTTIEKIYPDALDFFYKKSTEKPI